MVLEIFNLSTARLRGALERIKVRARGKIIFFMGLNKISLRRKFVNIFRVGLVNMSNNNSFLVILGLDFLRLSATVFLILREGGAYGLSE